MLSKRLKELRALKGLSQAELARFIGMSQQAVAKWETEKATPDPEMLGKLADFFTVSTDYLIGRETKPITEILDFVKLPRETKKIPIIGCVKCGPDGLAFEYLEDYVSVSEDLGDDVVALKCRGDSMIGAGIYEGDTVIVRPQEKVESGQIAIVIINGEEGTLKKVRYHNDGKVMVLEAANSDYPPRIFAGKEMNTVRIFGRLLEIRRSF